jgi:hypothetical protein
MLRIAIATVALAAVLLGATAHAAERPSGPLVHVPDSYLYGCTAEESRSVDFREFQRSPDKFLRHCVRIVGVLYEHGEVFADEADLYRHYTSFTAGDLLNIGIGTYAAKQSVGSWKYRSRSELIGRAYSCEALLEEFVTGIPEENRNPGPPARAILSGYCQYYGSPIIFISEVRTLDPGPLRLTGPDAAASYGDLDEVPENHPLYKEISGDIVSWIRAVANAGSPEHRELIAPCDHAELPYTPENCRKANMEWAKAFSTKPASSLRYFIRKPRPNDVAGDYQAFGCLCRIESCDHLWPIHSLDVGLHKALVCKRIDRVNGSTTLPAGRR